MAALFKNWRTTFERIDKFLSDTYFTDVNVTRMINVEKAELTQIDHLLIATNPPVSTEQSFHLFDDSALSFSDVSSYGEDQWESVVMDTFTFGLTWSVHWFRLKFCVSSEWLEKRHHSIELRWNSGCEVLVFTSTGQLVQGLNATDSRRSVDILQLTPITVDSNSSHYLVFLQVSCSDLFGAGNCGMINPPCPDKSYKISLAHLQLVYQPAEMLRRDLTLLLQMAENLKDTERGFQALFAANQAINTVVDLSCDNLDGKITRALHSIDLFFQEKSAEITTLHVMGHCHIDTAWLWRYGETRRKIARSWSTTVGLLERYYNMKFVCSQAQQMDWLKEDHPELFSRIQTAASKNQFLPVGGTWVEMDVNIPCCESLCRQFLYGQRFFKDNFGKYCNEFWLPDTFGYSPQLPQIMRQCRISRFMTQKLSWSLVNKFPHHTFIWKGLDGSSVLTHFPPGESYAMKAKVSEILHSIKNFSDKGRSSSIMYLYGHGDGGQGPTDEMVYSLNRLKDCNGLPKICHSSPEDFFSKIESQDLNKLCTWNGELFLELHNGTYTTQRQLKLGNSHCEQALRAVEMLMSIACCQGRLNQTVKNLEILTLLDKETEVQWKMLLLNQFHDVLPGSSIESVCDDAYWCHRSILYWSKNSIHKLISLLDINSPFIINPTSWPIFFPLYSDSPSNYIGLCEIPAHSILSVASTYEVSYKVHYSFNEDTNLHMLSNRFVSVSVDSHCRIRKLHLKSHPDIENFIREDSMANELILYDDVPLYWDAWDVMDYHLETGVTIDHVPSFHLVQGADVIVDESSVTLVAKFCLENTGTTIEQTITLYKHLEYVQMSSKVIKWNETHRILKLKIPTIANAIEAQYRTQAGYHSRPTHRNTSWDSAKFEVCGHDWVHVGEANWGIGVLKEAIFGSSVVDGTFYLSLLRSPASPDATADKKHLPHVFNYAIYPYLSSYINKFAVLTRLATQFNWLCFWKTSEFSQCSMKNNVSYNLKSFPVYLESPINGEIAIDWIKPSCGNINQIVIRLHEQVGGRFSTKLASSLPIKQAQVTNVIEDPESRDDTVIAFTKHSITIFMFPFKIVSVVIEFI